VIGGEQQRGRRWGADELARAWGSRGISCDRKGALVWVGHANPEDANAMVHLKSPAFAAVVMTAMDGQPFEASRKILVAACRSCENVGMQFSEDRHTVGQNWETGGAD